MSEQELINAMHLGSQRSGNERTEKDLGRFGLGLKNHFILSMQTINRCQQKNNKVSGFESDLECIKKP